MGVVAFGRSPWRNEQNFGCHCERYGLGEHTVTFTIQIIDTVLGARHCAWSEALLLE
jgi:hypothetical protein